MTKANIVLIVDLDYTLVKTNTTYEFIRLLYPIRYLIISILFTPLSFLNLIFRQDFLKRALVMLCLKGHEKDFLEQYGKVYFKKVVSKYRNEYYNSKVYITVQKCNAVKVLLTASLDFIANNFKELGFDIVKASVSYYKNNKLYSYVDLYGRKSKIIKVFLKHFRRVIVIDDDPEPLLGSINGRLTIIRVPR